MIDDLIKKLSKEIYSRRFFLERIAVFKKEFEDRIIFLYPIDSRYLNAVDCVKDRKYFLGILDNFKLCLLEIWEDETGETRLKTPVFTVDTRTFLDEDILKVKISRFLGLKIELLGDANIPHIYLDLIYYTLALGMEKNAETSDLSRTVSFPLSWIFDDKLVFEKSSPKTNEIESTWEPGIKAKCHFRNVNRYENKNGLLNVNIGVLDRHYKSIGIENREEGDRLILKTWNPFDPEVIKIPGNTENEQIIALHTDNDYIYVSCESERIYRLSYESDKFDTFKPGNNLFTRSLLKIGNYLVAALTNRTICRIHLESGKMDSHVLESPPLFLSPLDEDKLIITTKQKELMIFRVIDEIETDEWKVYDYFGQNWDHFTQKLGIEIDIQTAFCEILKKESLEESHIAALEFAVYSWIEFHPDDIYTPLKSLIYVISRSFQYKPDKAEIILRFIDRYNQKIFENYEHYSILFKEFYIATCDKYRSDFLELIQVHNPTIKNELDYLTWNGSNENNREAEDLVNAIELYFFYKESFYIEYVKNIPDIHHPVAEGERKPVISYFRIADTVSSFQLVSVVESTQYNLYLLDRDFFESGIPPDPLPLDIQGKSIIRKIQLSADGHYMFYSDETRELKIFELPRHNNTDILVPAKVNLKDVSWDIDTMPVRIEGKPYEIVVMGFKNSGFNICLFDYDHPDMLEVLYENNLREDWIRDLDIIEVDGEKYQYEIAAVGDKGKRLYRFVFQLRYDGVMRKFNIEPGDIQVKKSTRSLYCVKFFSDRDGHRAIVVGSDQGDLFFMDEQLNIKWQQKLIDSIRKIKICSGKNKLQKDIVVGIGNGDIYFFSPEGFVRREIRFGKPLSSIDTGLLDTEKEGYHVIACTDNRLVVYEINPERLGKEIMASPLLKGKHLSDPASLDIHVAELYERLKQQNGFDSKLPVLAAADSLICYYRWQSVDFLINSFKAGSNCMVDYYTKSQGLFLRSLGNAIDNTDEYNYPSIEKFFQYLSREPEPSDDPQKQEMYDDENIQWSILKFYQKVFQNYKTGEKKEFLDVMERLMIAPHTRRIKSVYAGSQWLLESAAIAVATVLHIDEENLLIIINDLLAKNMPHQVYDALAGYFNHKSVLGYIFSLYCEVDKSPVIEIKEIFKYLIQRFKEKEKLITDSGVKHLNILILFYQRILNAANVHTLIGQQLIDSEIDITQPIYELEAAGFEIRPHFKEMFHTLQDIPLKEIDQKKYMIQKIETIQEVKLVLGHILATSRESQHLGNKLLNMIAFHWDRILTNTLTEFQETISLELKFKEIVDNIALDSSALHLENVGGATAVIVRVHAVSDSLQPRPDPLLIDNIEPGPGHEIMITISELLQNPSKQAGKFTIKLEIDYTDTHKNQRKFFLQFELTILSSLKFLRESKWKEFCEINHNLFDYSAYYPRMYQAVSQTIRETMRKKSGLIFLQGEEGVGRSSLMVHLSLFLELEGGILNYYVPIDSKTRGIPGKMNRFNSILHQVLETIENKSLNGYNTPDSYVKKISTFFRESRDEGVLFINNLEQLKPDSFIEFYILLKEISGFAVVVAAVNRHMIRLLKLKYTEINVIDISTISPQDQENLFKIEVGENYDNILPSNWNLLVGNHVYSNFLLGRVLKNEKEQLSTDDCIERMWQFYRKEKNSGKIDYYMKVWETLSMHEKLIAYLCAKEHTDIPLDGLKEGMFVGSDPYLLKRNVPEYKIVVKVKMQGDLVNQYSLEENHILEEQDIDYLQRARDRIILKNTQKGLFPVKIQNEDTLLARNRFYRVVLANYLSEKGALEKELEQLCGLGILREVMIGGKTFYCHNDYIFMIYLLQIFENYDTLVEKNELVTGYTLKEIKYALANQLDRDERSQFLKFLDLDEYRINLFDKLHSLWEQFRLTPTEVTPFYTFLMQVFYLDKVKEYPDIQVFDHFSEGFFQFKIQVVNKFSHGTFIIVPDENADLTQLGFRLPEMLNYYRLAKGTELIILVTLFDRRKLSLDIEKFDLNIVLFDENSLKQYIHSEKKELELLRQIAHYLDLRILSPYRYRKGISGDMFVGRRNELGTIFNNPNTDFAIFGERMIGKTSLLKQIVYQCKERVEYSNIHPIFIDLFTVSNSSGFFQKLNNTFKYESMGNHAALKDIKDMGDFEGVVAQYLNANIRTHLIFLLDEIDDLYANCFVECVNCSARHMVTTDNYNRIKTGFTCSFCDVSNIPGKIKPRQEIEAVHSIFAAFRSISQTYNRCQFIFTGFKILFHLHKEYGYEFMNFTQPLNLGNLEYQDLYGLVIDPMKRLNIRFSSETDIMSNLYDRSLNGIPWIIQFYCNRIIDMLADSPEPVVTSRLVDEITMEIKPEIDKILGFTIRTSRERGIFKLILLYRQKMGMQLGQEFRVDDLLEYQKMLEIPPEQFFKKAELDYYLDLFSRCFFLKKEQKIKGGTLTPQWYFQLTIDPKLFDSFQEMDRE